MCKKVKSKKGFTLLEIMIAMAILAGVVVTIISTLNYHLSFVEKSRNTTIATLLAKEKLEDIKTNGMSESMDGDFYPDFTDFRWRYDSEELAIKGIYKVYLTVSWGKNDKVTLETYETRK